MSNRLFTFCVWCVLATTAYNASAMDLADALAAAEKNDPALASARASRDAAFENIAIAKSKLLPQVNFQSGLNKMQYAVAQQTPTGASVGNSYLINAYNNELSLHQGLYHPRDTLGVEVGQQQAVYGDAKLASARSDLWMRTTNAWLDVLVAVENQRVFAKAVTASQKVVEQAQQRIQAGEGTHDTLVEAQAQLAQTKAEWGEAGITLRARQLAFQTLTGQFPMGLESRRLPPYNKVHLEIEDKGQFQKLVQDTNPDIKVAVAARVVNQKRAEQAHADELPTVDFVLSKTWAQNDTVFTINQTYNVLAAGVQMSIPLYAGGGLQATEQQAQLAARAAAEDVRTEQFKRITAVDVDWASVDASIERARAAQTLWEAALEQRKAAEMGITSGHRTWGDVAQAENLMARREADKVSYEANVLRSQARLLSNLPVTENVWEPWIAQLSVLSH